MFLRFLIAQCRCPASLYGSIPSFAHWRLSALPRYLQPDQVEKIIVSPDPKTPIGSRNKAIFLLLARLGFRAGDVVRLQFSDLDWKEGMIRVSGKGRRETVLPLSQEVGDALAAYIKDHRPPLRPMQCLFDHLLPIVLSLSRLHLDHGCSRDAPCRHQLPEARGSSCPPPFRCKFHATRRGVPTRDRRCAPSSLASDDRDLRQSGCGHPAADRAAMAGGEDMLSHDVPACLNVRRAMGFAMKWSGNLLRSFATFSEAQGQYNIRSQIAITWAASAPSARTRARRLGSVIRLARYLRAENQHHEVPPPAFGREERPRHTPYIYSREDIQRLVQAASEIGCYPNPEYRGLTYSTFFGLLACTGMRLSETINLRLPDITADGLIIRNTKFRKSRLIPLHPTAQAVLKRYLSKRRLFAPLDDHVFVSLRKHKLLRHDAYVAFRKCIEKVGLQRQIAPAKGVLERWNHRPACRGSRVGQVRRSFQNANHDQYFRRQQ